MISIIPYYYNIIQQHPRSHSSVKALLRNLPETCRKKGKNKADVLEKSLA